MVELNTIILIAVVLELFYTPLIVKCNDIFEDACEMNTNFITTIIYRERISMAPKTYSNLCSGTLLNPRWILTAASCISAEEEGLRPTAVLETYKIGSPNFSKTIKIEAIFKHPDFNKTTLENDIGLIKLHSDINQNSNVKFVKIPEKYEHDIYYTLSKFCSKVLVIGIDWAASKVMDKDQSHDILKCAYLNILNPVECTKFFDKLNKTVYVNINKQICTRSNNGEIALHQQFGGPLICKSIQYGISSSIPLETTKNIPSVFTRVDRYSYFIYSTMERNTTSSTSYLKVLSILFIIYTFYIFTL